MSAASCLSAGIFCLVRAIDDANLVQAEKHSQAIESVAQKNVLLLSRDEG
jgi:hypothetical protein